MDSKPQQSHDTSAQVFASQAWGKTWDTQWQQPDSSTDSPHDEQLPAPPTEEKQPALRKPRIEKPRQTSRRKSKPVVTTRRSIITHVVLFFSILFTIIRSISARKMRAVLTAMGTALGVATLVATISLTEAARNQISHIFSAYELYELSAQVAADRQPPPTSQNKNATAPSERLVRADRLAALNARKDVQAAGILQTCQEQMTATVSPLREGISIGAVLADPVILTHLQPTMQWGSIDNLTANSVLLPAHLASRLNVPHKTVRAIYLNQQRFVIAGVIDDVPMHNELLMNVVLSPVLITDFCNSEQANVTIFTEPGTTKSVAAAVPYLLKPEEPSYVSVGSQLHSDSIKQTVDNSVAQLMIMLGIVALGISSLGIANTTLTAVMERAGEIGLKRAVGARRRDIALETITESVTLGAGGAIFGVWLGVMVTTLVCIWLGWKPVIVTDTLFVGPISGVVIGIASGLYPAWKAATLDPVESLQR